MKNLTGLMFVLALVFGVTGSANAALTKIGTATYMGNDYNLIYEDDAFEGGLVWLDYTNTDLSWQGQVNWASGLGSNLTVSLDPGYTTDIDWSIGWRLPLIQGQLEYDTAPILKSGDMHHLYHDSLGMTFTPYGDPLEGISPFTNLRSDYYWTGTYYSTYYGSALTFTFSSGENSVFAAWSANAALAVHQGTVIYEGIDNDGDGFLEDIDCNDNDSSVYPGAPELCDGKDNDCDGSPMDTEIDTDEDGYLACDDCNDEDYAVNKDAVEIPNNYVDENCDGDFGDCYPCDSWRNHGAYVRCVAQAVDEWCDLGVFTEEECDTLVNSAAKSDIGKKEYTPPECE